MPCEVTITLKNEYKSMTKKTMVYQDLQADYADPKIDSLISDASREFGDKATKTSISIKLIE